MGDENLTVSVQHDDAGNIMATVTGWKIAPECKNQVFAAPEDLTDLHLKRVNLQTGKIEAQPDLIKKFQDLKIYNDKLAADEQAAIDAAVAEEETK